MYGAWRCGSTRACWERMGFNNIGVGYRDAAVSSGRLKMARVEVNSFRFLGVWGRGGKAPGVCENIGYRDAAV